MYKIIIVLLAVAILLGGWYALMTRGPAEAPRPEALMSASFSCEDGSRFIAEFTANDQLRVVVDGEVARTLPRVAGAGQRFENSEYLYVFAGEEGTVTTKASGAATTCSQPFDANNAPVNFGDMGEGAGEGQDAAAVSANIVGAWQSSEDTKFTRTFRVDGTVTDLYDGGAAVEGTWRAYTSVDAGEVPFTLEAGAVYVSIDDGSDTLNFKVGSVTPERLELIYMDRGGVLSFTRVQ